MRKRSLIVSTVARWIVAFICLYGIEVIVYGHHSPGGGFAGGVILASAFVLVMLAEGREGILRLFPVRAATRLVSAGAGAFLVVALLGIALGPGFVSNFLHSAAQTRDILPGGVIPLCEVAIGVEVCAGLLLVAAVLSSLRFGKAAGTNGFTSIDDG